jgi:hypothetical protein
LGVAHQYRGGIAQNITHLKIPPFESEGLKTTRIWRITSNHKEPSGPTTATCDKPTREPKVSSVFRVQTIFHPHTLLRSWITAFEMPVFLKSRRFGSGTKSLSLCLGSFLNIHANVHNVRDASFPLWDFHWFLAALAVTIRLGCAT